MSETTNPMAPLVHEIARLVGEVLMTEVTEAHYEAELVGDLGAESIDFLDLLFRIEDLIGMRISPEMWWTYVDEKIESPEGGAGITVRFVHAFATDMLHGTIGTELSTESQEPS